MLLRDLASFLELEDAGCLRSTRREVQWRRKETQGDEDGQEHGAGAAVRVFLGVERQDDEGAHQGQEELIKVERPSDRIE
ncbi:hypothetical protein EYF80_068137 [Liparis tanakae]|uniref:Uncharacterized protein n=1 Tax=Liparis tanakae TaxID=230148 RepID=A0A4Z2DZS7_9TELE|nr:hypothetical protein EYF80_068137 [Liparis tanakae]